MVAVLVMPALAGMALSQEMEVIFSDDFEGYADGAPPSDEWSVFSGHWFIKDGVLHQDAGSFDYGLVAKNFYLRCDYRIEAKVQLVGGGAGAGLYWNVFNAQTGESGHMLRYDGNRPIMYGFMSGRGFLGTGGATGDLFADGTWHTIRMDVNNSKGTFDVHWDGKKIADAALLYHKSGYAGLECSLGHSAFDDFKLSVPKGTDWRAAPTGEVRPEWVQSIALMPDGNIVYPIRNMHRIQIVSPDGTLVSEFGAYGPQPGQLNLPAAVAVDKEGLIYVTESGNNRVQVFDASGASRKILKIDGGGSLEQPFGIAVDDSGNVWVGDKANNRIVCFGESTIAIGGPGAAPGQFNGPSHLSFIMGRLYVADTGNSRIQIIDPKKVLEEPQVVGISRQPFRSVQYDGKGTFLVTGHGVQTYDRAWNKLGDLNLGAADRAGSDCALYDRSGNILLADSWSSRILTVKPHSEAGVPTVSDITRTSAVVTWKTDFPAPTKLMLLDTPQRSTIPPTTDYSSARVFSDEKRTTEHRVELTDLKPATRHVFAIASPVRTIPDTEHSRDYRFTTDAPEGMHQYTSVPVAVLCYMHLVSPGAKKPDGSPADPSIKEDSWFDRQVGFHKASRFFYMMNSRFRFDLDFQCVKVTRPVDVSTLGSSSEEVYKDLAEYAQKKGMKPEDFGGVIVAGAAGYYAYPWPTPWWGGKLTFTTGCCFIGGGDTWFTTHEFHHVTEGWFSMIGYPGAFGETVPYCSADGPWTHPGRFGEHYDFLAHTLRSTPDKGFLNQAVGKIRLSADKDEDGVPDDDPFLVFDENRAGTKPNDKFSYGNGLTDLQNITAEIFTPAIRGHKHPMLTKEIDYKYPFAIYDYDYERKKKTPTIDGKIARREWSEFVNSPNPVCPMNRDLPYGAAYPPVEDVDWRMNTYLNWDDNNIYVAAKAPYKFYLGVELDCNGDGYFKGHDNIHLGVGIPRDESTIKADDPFPVPGVRVWNNLETVQQTGMPNWTNEYFDKRENIKWAWAKADDGWYVIELAIPKCERVDLVPKEGNLGGIRIVPQGYLPPTEKNKDPRYGLAFTDLYEYAYFKLVK
jgi:hypothetical protein